MYTDCTQPILSQLVAPSSHPLTAVSALLSAQPILDTTSCSLSLLAILATSLTHFTLHTTSLRRQTHIMASAADTSNERWTSTSGLLPYGLHSYGGS